VSDAGKVVRCAIYTRKSSEEGLDQAFNSLQAQREACEAFIRSQAGERWVLIPDRYDDGGYSGATLNRPAMERLLADVSARRLDAVLVYKVDRLTRSLADFARIIEALDRREVAFVSITQAFNTTSSMGRLTLNVLLSFAQFEREVTSERIRDKIAASKAKGMWMGGCVPLGYDVPVDQSRALVVNDDEAQTVRTIFRWFLQSGNLYALQNKLDAEGVGSKRWTSTRGRVMGGCKFSRGALRHLLGNRTYLGEIPHKGQVHPGRHSCVVDRPTFEAAQALLAANSGRRRTRISRASQMLLCGLLFDADGLSMEPCIGGPATKRYEYYASKPLPRSGLRGQLDDAIRRVPAHAIDRLVRTLVAQLLPSPDEVPSNLEVRGIIARVEIHPSTVQIVVCSRALPGRQSARSAIEVVRSHCRPGEHVLVDPNDSGLLRIVLPLRFVTYGGRKWLTSPSGRRVPAPKQPSPLLVRSLRRGHAIARACGIEPDSVAPARNARAPTSAHDRKLAVLAFLAPDLQRAILHGEITACDLEAIPISWTAQRRLLGWQPPVARLETEPSFSS
jgi:DNA invertase Pin-like site-specific DNA recombinase